MAGKNFKVVIAGGGIAGLGLANMLEMAGIDWVLLESHGDIAPQVGASIGLFPNGLRILDQIGVYETIRAVWGYHPMSNANRDAKGRIICFSPAMGDHLEKRHGYPFIFIDRRSLLQILFDKLKHKDRIHLGKKVASVSMRENGVQVTTVDEETFEGDILVGADGIHSRVREEMWRIGEQIQPGVFLKDRDSPMSCRYKCVFGISEMDQALDSNQFVCGDGHSYLICPGPGKRTYWFLFVNTGKDRLNGDQIPRYTKEDEAWLVKNRFGDPITETLTFGDLYESCLYSTLTPLVEHVFKRWHFGRVMLMGDSAHKHNPIAGQGGMSALESTAALVNELMNMFKQGHGHSLLNEDYEKMFARVQACFEARVKRLVKAANDQQRLLANDHLMSGLVPVFLGTFGGLEHDLWHLGKRVIGAIRLHDFPIPKRPRLIPFIDELPAQSYRKRWMFTWQFVVFTGVIFLTLRNLLNSLGPQGKFVISTGWDLSQTYTSSYLDWVLSTLMSIFSHIVSVKEGIATNLLFTNGMSILFAVMIIGLISFHWLG